MPGYFWTGDKDPKHEPLESDYLKSIQSLLDKVISQRERLQLMMTCFTGISKRKQSSEIY